jgi:hypothetical protein
MASLSMVTLEEKTLVHWNGPLNEVSLRDLGGILASLTKGILGLCICLTVVFSVTLGSAAPTTGPAADYLQAILV